MMHKVLILTAAFCLIGLAASTRAFIRAKGRQPPPIPSHPPYPITASYFKDRFTFGEWNETLHKFASIGGDTVLLRAPRLTIRTEADLMRDPDFAGCGSIGGAYATCVKDAKNELAAMGLNVTFATFKYEEDFSAKLIVCEKYDRRIDYTRVAYRLVIPLKTNSSNRCDLPKGSEVLVVFTMFSGIDPHQKLIESATKRKIHVYFGLPKAPTLIEGGRLSVNHMDAYYEFIRRVLEDHQYRYNSSAHYDTTLRWHQRGSAPPQAFSPLQGYFIGDSALLTDINNKNESIMQQNDSYQMLDLYRNIGKLIHGFRKKAIVMTTINLEKKKNNSLNAHVLGFEALAKTKAVDVLAVSEGRGYGVGCYYYPTEVNKTVKSVDPELAKILHYRYPNLKENFTFHQHFIGSNNELFGKFADSRDSLNGAGYHFDFWLNIEAFEYVPNDPCLPVDTAGSGMTEIVSRTTKRRLDAALTAAGMFPQKVAATAWDPGFTCTPMGYNTSLVDDVAADVTRTIVSYCGWHSKQNMSIVLIGYGVGGNNQVTYYIREGQQKQEKRYGYYFEGEWGSDHNRVPSLIYTQLYDIMDPFDISMNGTITVLPDGAYWPCEFQYDYRT